MNSQKLDGNYYYAVSSNTIVKVLSGMGVAFDGVTFEDKAQAVADAEKKAKEQEEAAKLKALEESAKNSQAAMPKWVLPVIIVLAVVLILAIVALIVVIVLMSKKKNNNVEEIKITNEPQRYQFQPSAPADFGGEVSSDTTVLGAGSATINTMAGTNMAAPSQQLNVGSLERKKNGENIAITKAAFNMGKDDLHCDYCIRDNNTISRQHAIIRIIGNTVYVEDNNSKNGTFLNGVMLVAGQRQELRDGDVITLSNEDFIFRK